MNIAPIPVATVAGDTIDVGAAIDRPTIVVLARNYG
jgi:hypothetical protein